MFLIFLILLGFLLYILKKKGKFGGKRWFGGNLYGDKYCDDLENNIKKANKAIKETDRISTALRGRLSELNKNLDNLDKNLTRSTEADLIQESNEVLNQIKLNKATQEGFYNFRKELNHEKENCRKYVENKMERAEMNHKYFEDNFFND